MGLGGVSDLDQRDDAEPGIARARLSQALGAPRHSAQNPEALEAFKKNLPATLEAIRAGLPKGTPLELWWQDEARVGQKNKIARRWARRGTRPRAPHDQRTSSVYIFGAICPQQGKGAALVLPRCDTQAMSLHLAEVAQAVAPGAHGVMLMDRAGWHRTKDLVVPDNLTLVLLPARAPELNPVENIWHFLRDNWLSSRVFASYRDIVDHCCSAWNRLIDVSIRSGPPCRAWVRVRSIRVCWIDLDRAHVWT